MTLSKENPKPPPRLPAVALAWNYSEWGGAQIYFLGIARQLKGRAVFSMLMPKDTPALFQDLCVREGIEVRLLSRRAPVIPETSLAGKMRNHIKKVMSEVEMASALLKGRFDLAHVDLSPRFSLLALAVISWRLPTFTTIHNRVVSPNRFRTALWRSKLAFASRLRNLVMLASNVDAKTNLLELCPTMDPESIPVTYTSASREELEPLVRPARDRDASRRRLGIGPGEVVFATVAQFIDRKGPWTLLEAARTACSSSDRVRFLWITSSEIGDSARRRISGYGLESRFELLDMDESFGSRTAMLEFLSACDVFVLPSQVDGLPIAILEAMFLGLPCISTRVNAIPEAVAEGVTGLLVEPDQPEALADSILRLAQDAPLRERLGRSGAERVRTMFLEEDVAEKVWKLYSASRRIA